MFAKRYLWAAVALGLCMGATSAWAKTIQVTIEKMTFSPATINAKVGDTIEWVNKDILVHTATVKGGWDVLIPPNKSASTVIKNVGEIDYYCRFHPNMTGRILATAP